MVDAGTLMIVVAGEKRGRDVNDNEMGGIESQFEPPLKRTKREDAVAVTTTSSITEPGDSTSIVDPGSTATINELIEESIPKQGNQDTKDKEGTGEGSEEGEILEEEEEEEEE